MSLILKGIDLPTKKQKTLIVEIAWDGDVWVDNHDRYELKYNSAIQIPKGHGDIKDENEIIKRLEEKEEEPLYQHDKDDWWVGIIVAETVVNNSPTILEAEE